MNHIHACLPYSRKLLVHSSIEVQVNIVMASEEEEELRQCARYGEYEEMEALLLQVGNAHEIIRNTQICMYVYV